MRVCTGTDWCFEAFVDVKIPGAGDDLLSSAAESLGMYSSRGCVENRCVSTPARKDPTWSHVPWMAGQGLFCFCSAYYVFYNLPVSGIGKRK